MSDKFNCLLDAKASAEEEYRKQEEHEKELRREIKEMEDRKMKTMDKIGALDAIRIEVNKQKLSEAERRFNQKALRVEGETRLLKKKKKAAEAAVKETQGRGWEIKRRCAARKIQNCWKEFHSRI